MNGYIILGKGNITRETDKAYGLSISDDSRLIWLPKSLVTIEVNESDNQTIYVYMPQWLARKNGLTGYDCFGQRVFHIS